MKSTLTAGLVASALLLQQAAATGSWGDAPSFPSPSNCNNTCTPDQESGFNWSGLPTGGFSNYGGFGFSGFTCQDSFEGKSKRSLETRSDFQPRCIQGSVGKSTGGGPSFSCGKDDAFSISHMQVSVSYDTDLDFVFSMPDGSTCKHTASCKASGSTIENSQCGGAKSVTFNLPPSSGKSSCDVGIHSIGFNCNTPPPPPATSSTTSIGLRTSSTTSVGSSTSSTTSVGSSTSSTTSVGSSTSSTTSAGPSTSSTASVGTSTSPPVKTTWATTPGVWGNTTSTTPGREIPTSSSTTVTTSEKETPSTTAVVTTGWSTTSSNGRGFTTTTPGKQLPPTTFTTTAFSTISSSSTSAAPPPPGSSAPCPPVLPSCLNTWLSLVPKCSSNSDTKCFCPSPEFIASVQECVSAWSGSDSEITSALSYLAGICADFVPQNPGICTGIPTGITLIPSVTPVTSTQTNGIGRGSRPAVQGPTPAPVTTLTFTVTKSEGGAVMTTVTVPAVSFVTATETGAQGGGVGLVPWGSPATPTPVSGNGNGAPAPAGGCSGSECPAPAAPAPASTVAAGKTFSFPSASSTTAGVAPAQFTGAAGKTEFGILAGALAVVAFLA